ncbi:methionine synthase reductase [Bicyclus anynana]|uniref:Methionine synthase reductase n=1 Tax=Bicyclus anynana TaxID=110368 RepID=A0A6J1P9T3_BICAN|nr:methionine synthase reductase [Bicyclus anynana]
MVVSPHFQDLFECLNESEVLHLPTLKEKALKINFTDSADEIHTVYKGQEPQLPFAASEVFQAPIHSWRRLTAVDEGCKAVYELSLDVKDSDLNFRPGDTIGIIPQNLQSEVDSVLKHLHIEHEAGRKYTILTDTSQKGTRIPPHVPIESTLRHVLTYCVDLRGILKKLFLLALSRYTKEANEKRILEYFSSKEGSVAYTTQILEKHICLLDIFKIFQSCKPPVELLLEYLPRLLPRPYSIANSNNERIIKICFSVICIGNNRKGLTTGWLEDIITEHYGNSIEEKMKNIDINDKKIKIPIYIRKNTNNFYLPDDIGTPIILIGPGTGIAPFIGFLEERQNVKANNPEANLGRTWLFFGCRNPNLDFIYEEELNNFISNGVLNKLCTSFSRYGNTENCYVQDAIKLNGEEVAKLLMQGARVYVCGDIKKMAESVREAIEECIATHGDEASAHDFVANMIKEKKYINDIWN